MLLSGTLLPLEGGPGWMQALSKVNPLTHLVDAEPALFAGELADASVVYGALSAAVVAVVGLWVGIRMIERGSACAIPRVGLVGAGPRATGSLPP